MKKSIKLLLIIVGMFLSEFFFANAVVPSPDGSRAEGDEYCMNQPGNNKGHCVELLEGGYACAVRHWLQSSDCVVSPNSCEPE